MAKAMIAGASGVRLNVKIHQLQAIMRKASEGGYGEASAHIQQRSQTELDAATRAKGYKNEQA